MIEHKIIGVVINIMITILVDCQMVVVVIMKLKVGVFRDFEQESHNEKKSSEGEFPVDIPQAICQRI